MAEDMKLSTVGPRKKLQGSIGHRVKRKVHFEQMTYVLLSWKNTSGMHFALFVFKVKKVYHNAHRQRVIITTLSGGQFFFPF